MLFDLVQSFILGFAITAIPGAVFFEAVRRVMAKKSSVVSFLGGNFAGIIAVIVLVFLGTSVLLTEPFIESVFYAASGLTLSVIGIHSVLRAPHSDTAVFDGVAIHRSQLAAFLTGFVLAAANPVGIIFWVSFIGTFAGGMPPLFIFVNILAVLAGVMSLFVLLMFVVGKLKVHLSNRVLSWLTRAFGGVIAAYGLVMLAKLFSL